MAQASQVSPTGHSVAETQGLLVSPVTPCLCGPVYQTGPRAC